LEKFSEQLVQLKELLVEYFESNVEYYKLAGFEKLMRFVVALVFIAVFFMMGTLALLLFAFGAALWLGNLLENEVGGYLVIGSFFVFLLLMVYLFKKPFIERPLIKIFSVFLYQGEKKDKSG